jgi:hypothetical protein
MVFVPSPSIRPPTGVQGHFTIVNMSFHKKDIGTFIMSPALIECARIGRVCKVGLYLRILNAVAHLLRLKIGIGDYFRFVPLSHPMPDIVFAGGISKH